MATRARNNNQTGQDSGSYSHDEQAVQRPEVGVQESFQDRRKPRTYRYDSSLSPELAWDENASRALAEWLIELITQAAEDGEASVFQSPQVWEGTGEAFRSTRECAARLRSLTKPFLNWSGKAERQQISVPTIPLFVHERHSTNAIIKGLESYRRTGTNLELFGDPQLDIADKLDAYEHKGPWTNRLVLGDSLQVMNSLLEYEGLGGQVQMIYMDPPYGVKFGSNFQPFVRQRKVQHGKDGEMIREPEMVKAYRDTWELGIHSYLTYLRDRLMLARELLHESGSIFVQISDTNLHFVRELMDEVFGTDNFVTLINFKTMMPLESGKIEAVVDYLCWYAKDKVVMKYKNLWKPKHVGAGSEFVFADSADGSYRRLTTSELDAFTVTAAEKRVFKRSDLASSGYTPSCTFPIEFDGRVFTTKRGKSWRTTPSGVSRLIAANRLFVLGQKLYYKMYLRDFGYGSLINQWTDTIEFGGRSYVVQTTPTVIQRCMLMTTDPGDLVFDPTCGSGTTAYVAEQWGRRWITCDTSRVPLALARQRLLTATFPWYDLKEPDRGPAGGFRYERKQNRKGEEVGGLVPRITLKSIANNEEPEMVTLVDRPEENKTVTRVTGPFTVEATIQAAQSIEEPTEAGEDTPAESSAFENPSVYLDRMIEVLRQSHTLQLPGNRSLSFDQVRPLDAETHEYLHAEAIENNGEEQRVAIVFGPEDGAISSDVVYNAAREAHFLRFDALYFFGFAIQAKARSLIDDRKKLRIPCFYVTVTPDVVMSDLLKTSKSSEVFSVTGLPDVRFEPTGSKTANGDPLYAVELLGLDIFRPRDLETESIAAENLPCWMLDTDYDGMVFIARQVFFPKTSAWDNLQKALKGRFDDSVWDHLAGTVSEPFVLGGHQRIAVKVMDERGNELMVTRGLRETD
ncbi:site-specific DNA-methyltransferase [Thiohalocapsa halophila]|uniref:site-specific DNA-methyltransferase (adenine-specific) n=1 Tax=Thiohalocapsa halophila TaxID=69359 RepID=A0ABS1CFG1_9GAMM|nr:site-specific DNA-methyltransferase [Thiohalocapsa halophila]MBK1630647.1 site-specific DNA-methyltransferase [Thiohalocapsa halophila]